MPALDEEVDLPDAGLRRLDADATERSPRTSRTRPVARSPSEAATASARAWPRPVSATHAPAATSARAIARPSPLVPPVTSARVARRSARVSRRGWRPRVNPRSTGRRPWLRWTASTLQMRGLGPEHTSARGAGQRGPGRTQCRQDELQIPALERARNSSLGRSGFRHRPNRRRQAPRGSTDAGRDGRGPADHPSSEISTRSPLLNVSRRRLPSSKNSTSSRWRASIRNDAIGANTSST